jgi:prevent-host-death family protein
MVNDEPTRSYSVDKAHAAFSKLVERALAGEPQRITGHGREAVILVSESEWTARSKSAPSLGALLARHARAGRALPSEERTFTSTRPLGSDFS